ncbi:hypothetical protein HNQ60_001498 [Povalibacter uvarum]|uniref:6-phosphogluconate dehydrogenase n=1 Tax=Povalibacter uvarum TaxID=732238 RepID=A0A841HJZ6_9GAMM|nr:hypothetical protein [Povalibacter uvarum]MBB6092620.1 hypothetical protein [Povalibacter uvarum]
MVQEAVVRRRGGFRKFMLIALTALLAGVLLWTWFSLSWSYSDGDRAGVLLKFSKKGWICKTYEGQLALYVVGGVAPQLWDFSVRDEAVAKKLSGAVGQEIQLHYTEHRGVPTSCFAETQYFADGFTVVTKPRN